MHATKNYIKVGLTGGIGSGKTTAAKRFAQLGARVYQADAVSRSALDPDGACYEAVIHAFGREIVRDDGTIDRRRLGEIVFANDQKRSMLNGIIHPYVIHTLFSRAEQDCANEPNSIAVFEVPLLFESGMHQDMDYNIVVSCSEENRILRVMERDALTREQVLSRMRAQMPEEEKCSLADSVLKNDGTHGELIAQVDALYQQLIGGGTQS